MPVTQNPSLDFSARQPSLWYFSEGAAIFPCIGSPEGLIAANKRAIAVSDNGNAYIKTTDIVATGWVAFGGGGGGSGTVTSVGLTLPSALFDSPVVGSPVTTAGTLAAVLASQLQNLVFASPNGSAGTPSFRALVAADLPAGTGTLTNFTAGNLSPLFTSNVANPTTAPALTFAQVSQAQNLVFASPSGSAGNPTFRALTLADMPAGVTAGPPGNSVQYNGGSNNFAGEAEFTYDPTTASLFLGLVGTLSGQLDFRNANGARVRFRTNNPVNSDAILWDSLPTVNQVLTATGVSGQNITLGWSTPGGGGSPGGSSGQVQWNDASAFNGSSGITLTSSQATITAARYVTSMLDANGNELFLLTATASAVNELTYANAATGVWPSWTASGGDTNVGVRFVTKGTGAVQVPGGATFLPGLVVGSFTQFGIFQNAGGGFMTIASSNLGIKNNSSVSFCRDTFVGWCQSTTAPEDFSNWCGFKGDVTGVIRVSANGTNAGKFLVAQNGSSAQGFIHSEPDVTTAPAYYANLPSGSTQDIFTGKNNNNTRFVVSSGGKITGSLNNTSQNFRAGGQVFFSVSDFNNSGTGLTTLATNTLQANSISATGDNLEIEATFSFAANANNKTAKLTLGTTQIFTTGLIGLNGSTGHLWSRIYRTSSAAQRFVTVWTSDDPVLPSSVVYGTGTEDWTTALTIKAEGQGGATNDVTQHLWLGEVSLA